ncbi:Cationic peroxidase 1 [Dichanthelium oligosanthes]|uniref:Cationic peroxidase 1 n=1 Tax=Dichanthelium oligosanthes TaxID=888268 RepID=A0A1E5V9N9_9POAL|nr:Cationic peroxidase 1 [Dichanthelium oligosanthes]
MASPNNAGHSLLALALLLRFSAAYGQLSEDHYASACPLLDLKGTVRSVLAGELSKDPRMGASLLRLFFHDCFPQVRGCDASVLLVNEPARGIDSEQDAGPNQNSLRGFDVIDKIKAAVEAKCRGNVSCADILAVTAREAVVLLRGPSWPVRLGRLDSLNASRGKANSDLPDPSFSLQQLEKAFGGKGFSPREMVALSGGHTIGMARRYYGDLVNGTGVLNSDRVLMDGGEREKQVRTYSTDSNSFFTDFENAMFKMSEMSVITARDKGQIRLDCKRLNK